MQLKEMWEVPSIRGFWDFEKKCYTKSFVSRSKRKSPSLKYFKTKFALISRNRNSGNLVSRNNILY